ncbi:MAG: class I tRNA ligase family protein, partial [Candidatus Omnitrophica bacterium]|nr:class I tRNA ligase family protein [Candidatus Omnitrophota bacterium]
HCWRCKKPILFRAAQQWFLSVDHENLRERCLEAIQKKIRFVPEWGKNRIGSMMETRPDWCLSRQRSWGVPIPLIACTHCGKIFGAEIRERVVRAFREKGADSWFDLPVESFLPENPSCCAAPALRKEEDIIDVWFDSGASHHAVLIPRKEELSYPADLYLEGSDQHRGWFQTSLLVSMGVHDSPPFKSILTHGFVVDGQGRKMSKSLGNVIAPQDVMKTQGADILRLWVASCDYAEDVRLSPQILEQVAELYRKIRNTLRYLLGNLADFQPAQDRVEIGQLLPVDRWAVSRCAKVVEEATAAYEAYEFHKVVRVLSQFCTVDLSNFYLDSLKDRLYTFPPKDSARLSAQTALAFVLEALVKVAAPVLIFTADEAWESYGRFSETGNVHSSRWPKWEFLYDAALEEQWSSFFQVRDIVLKALEEQRNAGVIGDPAEAHVKVTVHVRQVWGRISPLIPWMAELLMVSSAQWVQAPGEGIATVFAGHAPGQKCQRCWRYTQDAGRSKEHQGLCARCLGALSMSGR